MAGRPRKRAQPKTFPPFAALGGENILSVSPRLLKIFLNAVEVIELCFLEDFFMP